MTNPRSSCHLCNFPLHLSPWVEAEQPQHLDCVVALKAQLDLLLATVGGRIENGELIFTSHGFSQWTRRKGNKVLEERIRELEIALARKTHLMPIAGDSKGVGCDLEVEVIL